jgi:hypothetical protein
MELVSTARILIAPFLSISDVDVLDAPFSADDTQQDSF